MEISTSDIIALGAFLLSAIAVVIAYYQGTKANSKAKKANKIAKKAFDLGLHDYKVKITPQLIADAWEFGLIINEPNSDYIEFVLKHKTNAKTTVKSIKFIGHFEPKQQCQIPLILGFNAEISISLQFRSQELRNTIVTRAQNANIQSNYDGQIIGSEIIFERIVRELINEVTIMIDHDDELNHPYTSILRYDKQTNHFVGDPISREI